MSLATFCCLCSFVKHQLTIFMWVYFWTVFCSIDLSILSPISHSLNYCISIVSLEIELCQPSNFVLFLQYCVGESFASPYKFKISLSIHKLLAGISIEIALNLWMSWKEMTSWQYWDFLSMNKKYFSIYLVWFCSSKFCSFPHIDLIHILFFLYLGIYLGGGTDVNVIVFLIPNSTCPLIEFDAVLITVALQYILKSGSMMPLA